MATSWYQDGATPRGRYYTEWRARRALQEIANTHEELAEVLVEWSWIFDENITIDEAQVIEYLNGIAEQTPDLTQTLIRLPWLADGIARWETSAMSTFYGLSMGDQSGFAAELAGAPWVTDGVTVLENLFGIGSLGPLASGSSDSIAKPQAARQLMGLIRYPTNVVDLFLVAALEFLNEKVASNVQTGMEEHWPDRLTPLLEASWFTDGLDQEERVYLIAAVGGAEPEQLHDSYVLEANLIELPLAGPVNLWAVGHHQFDAKSVLTRMELAVRGAEEFWGMPFPLEHVILYVMEDGRGVHIGHMMTLSESHASTNSSVFHETAHYYCKVGPSWYAEGCAEVVRVHIENDGDLPSSVPLDHCSNEGLQTLQDLNDLGSGGLWDTCRYPMGMNFLLTLQHVMGRESWFSALSAFYVEHIRDGRLFYSSSRDTDDDEAVYRTFMQHATPHLQESVNDVFKRLHGGPFIQ